jgi:hypothetical protein
MQRKRSGAFSRRRPRTGRQAERFIRTGRCAAARCAGDRHAQALRWARLREVRRVHAQVARQPACRERPGHEHGPQESELRGVVVAGGLDDDDEQPEHDHQQRDAAMEAAGLGVRPRIQGPDDLAPVIGVGARGLARAGIADMRLGRGSAPAGARRRTRAATGARPPGTPSGRASRRRRSPRCDSAASAGGCERTAIPGRRLPR